MEVTALQHALLSVVGEYLPTPSKIMLAVALAAPTLSWVRYQFQLPPTVYQHHCQLYSALSIENLSSLDFSDIEITLASKLRNIDMHAILICINASKHLKRLRISGCLSVSGVGLGPLIGSGIIEQLDLGISDMHERPCLSYPSSRKVPSLISLLKSIFASENCSLKQLQLPKKWRERPNAELTQCLERYSQILANRHSCCDNCGKTIELDLNQDPNNTWVVTNSNDISYSRYYGLQSFTCCKCTNHICDECKVPGSDVTFIEHCEACDHDYCANCVEMVKCELCNDPSTCYRCKICVKRGHKGCRG